MDDEIDGPDAWQYQQQLEQQQDAIEYQPSTLISDEKRT